MPKNPLAEVFGYPVDNLSQEASNHRQGRLCPYHNSSGLNCTKTSATDPLGVCTIYDGDKLVITCPIRFRQDSLILADAARFFFSGKLQSYLTLTEMRLKDAHSKSAGNIDIVLVTLDEQAKVVDFGAVEVQAVYISGNVRSAFREYLKNPQANFAMEWPSRNYPNPDYLSSSRKRLVPQLMFKGGILHEWQKKMAVVVHQGFFEQLPVLQEVDEHDADIAWFVYDLVYDKKVSRFQLRRIATRYTKFEDALSIISTPSVGDMSEFVALIEARIKKGKLSGLPLPSPVEPTVEPLPDAFEDD